MPRECPNNRRVAGANWHPSLTTGSTMRKYWSPFTLYPPHRSPNQQWKVDSAGGDLAYRARCANSQRRGDSGEDRQSSRVRSASTQSTVRSYRSRQSVLPSDRGGDGKEEQVVLSPGQSLMCGRTCGCCSLDRIRLNCRDHRCRP